MNVHTASRVSIILIVGGLIAPLAALEINRAPVNPVTEEGFLREWLVIGPFPNPVAEIPLPDGCTRLGFHQDYLAPLGGESGAVLTPQTTVSYTDEVLGATTAHTHHLSADDEGIVDFTQLFPNKRVAYAFCYVNSAKEQNVRCYFGSDDSPKVWINGKLVHELWTTEGGRASCRWQDEFTATLKEGLNPVLVKVEDRMGGWNFLFEIYSEEDHADQIAHVDRLLRLRRIQDLSLGPRSPWDTPMYVFSPSRFPEVGWRNPEWAEELMGRFHLRTQWYDADLNACTQAVKAGRYGAYVEGLSPDGIRIRRSFTVCCRPEYWFDWRNPPHVRLAYPAGGPVDRHVWREYRDIVSQELQNFFLNQISGQPEGGGFLAALIEQEPLGRKPKRWETPSILDADHHVRLKRKILGVENKYPPLRMPRERKDKPAPVLHRGQIREAGFQPGFPKAMQALCRNWYRESEEPFAVLIARHGVIAFHEAFGETKQGPMTLETERWIASITKALGGTLFAQFVDQGLIGLDDPVGKYLPDFPAEGDMAITLRQCFTHTTGLEGHHRWGSVANPWMDNHVAIGLESLEPGKVHRYNGVGYDLAGKVMEIVSGKSVLRLMYEHYLDPLGALHTTTDDLAGGGDSIPEDLARIGQMLLNKGSYGNLEFFSPDTCEAIMPKPLNQYYPDLEDVEWGIGLTWMRFDHPDTGKGDLPEDAKLLGPNLYGHGAASASIFLIDPDNDLVVIQTRDTAGETYEENSLKFLQCIHENLLP